MSALTASLAATPILNQPLLSSALPGSTKATGTSTQSSKFNAMNSQEFMELLTTELKHQDPTNPVNEQQLAGEMAQFSMATGINTLNSNMSALLRTESANRLMSASSLIGKQVTTQGSALVSNGQGDATGAFTLAGPARQVSVQVLNDKGKTVASLSLGSMGGGTHTFPWKAKAPNTAYAFMVSAVDGKGQRVTTTPRSIYTVSGIQQANGQVMLSLAGNDVTLPLSQVHEVL